MFCLPSPTGTHFMNFEELILSQKETGEQEETSRNRDKVFNQVLFPRVKKAPLKAKQQFHGS